MPLPSQHTVVLPPLRKGELRVPAHIDVYIYIYILESCNFVLCGLMPLPLPGLLQPQDCVPLISHLEPACVP